MAPKNHDRVKFTVWLDRPVHEGIVSLAERKRQTPSEVIRGLLADAVLMPCTGPAFIEVEQDGCYPLAPAPR